MIVSLMTAIHRLHREVEAFVNYISPTPVEDEVRSLVVDLVSRAVTQAFPDAEVKPFGSFGTKLYLPLGYVSVPIINSFYI
jgi:non-canonical poly(A) RNA polymerase PAPD5/7